MTMDEIARRQKKDISIIAKFTEVYCTSRHHESRRDAAALPFDLGKCSLCPECTVFLEYAVTRRLKCPLEAEKPSCKHCRIHCYDKLNRAKIREIMAYSGRKLMMSGRLDYLWHYYF